jgi:hypothetical protein
LKRWKGNAHSCPPFKAHVQYFGLAMLMTIQQIALQILIFLKLESNVALTVQKFTTPVSICPRAASNTLQSVKANAPTVRSMNLSMNTQLLFDQNLKHLFHDVRTLLLQAIHFQWFVSCATLNEPARPGTNGLLKVRVAITEAKCLATFVPFT